MRYLLVFLAFFAISCPEGDLGGKRHPHGGDPNPDCLSLCKDACDGYGAWSDWSPTADKANEVCEGEKFTQSRKKTRSCPRESSLCEGVTCPTEEKEDNEVDGKKDCTEPPDCDACCAEDWVVTNESTEEAKKQAAKVCPKETIKPMLTYKRDCDSCPSGHKCVTKKEEQGDERNGTISINCDVECPWGDWDVDINEKCNTETFTITRTRTCSKDRCNQCNTQETRENVRGGKECNTGGGDGTPTDTETPTITATTPDPVVTDDPVVTEICNQCDAACGEWGSWQRQGTASTCPTEINFGVMLTDVTSTYMRTRQCNNNPCANAGCFTTNEETRITKCDCPSPKILGGDGTCVCRSDGRWYGDMDDNECKVCPESHTLDKSANTCTPPPVCETECRAVSGMACITDEQPEGVCEGTDINGTRVIRECSPKGLSHNCTTTEGCTVKGTLERSCNECTEWITGDWSPEVECTEAARNSMKKSTFSQSRTPTRKCEGKCLRSDCPTRGKTETQTHECDYCKGTGQKLINEGRDDERCECDNEKHFVQDGDACKCKEGYKFNNENKKCEKLTACEQDPNCANCCGDWGGWDPAVTSCPDPTLFDKPIAKTYTRTRSCNDNGTLQCFTTNTETRTCTYCEGEGQKLNDGTCKCDAKNNYHRYTNTNENIDECIKCVPPSTFDAQTGKCNSPPVETTAEPPVVDPPPVEPPTTCTEPQQLVDGECVDPPPICTADGQQAPDNGSCDTDGGWYLVGDCCEECVPPKVLKDMGSGNWECVDPPTTCTKPKVLENGKCFCPQGKYPYSNSCADCQSSWGACVAKDDTDTNTECTDTDIPNGGTQTWRGTVHGNCTQPESTTKDCPVKGTNPCHGDCENCEAWQWESEDFAFSDDNQSCPSPHKFERPDDSLIKSRTRNRVCPDLRAGVECFTTNTETETCAWCQGEGQKKVVEATIEKCVCDTDYYKTKEGSEDVCKSCGGSVDEIVNYYTANMYSNCLCQYGGEKKTLAAVKEICSNLENDLNPYSTVVEKNTDNELMCGCEPIREHECITTALQQVAIDHNKRLEHEDFANSRYCHLRCKNEYRSCSSGEHVPAPQHQEFLEANSTTSEEDVQTAVNGWCTCRSAPPPSDDDEPDLQSFSFCRSAAHHIINNTKINCNNPDDQNPKDPCIKALEGMFKTKTCEENKRASDGIPPNHTEGCGSYGGAVIKISWTCDRD